MQPESYATLGFTRDELGRLVGWSTNIPDDSVWDSYDDRFEVDWSVPDQVRISAPDAERVMEVVLADGRAVSAVDRRPEALVGSPQVEYRWRFEHDGEAPTYAEWDREWRLGEHAVIEDWYRYEAGQLVEAGGNVRDSEDPPWNLRLSWDGDRLVSSHFEHPSAPFLGPSRVRVMGSAT